MFRNIDPLARAISETSTYACLAKKTAPYAANADVHGLSEEVESCFYDPHSGNNRPASFRYQPLDQSSKTVRLLKVLPGPDISAVKCLLLHCSLDKCPSYKALSYTWDHEGPCKYIECCGMPFAVSRGLWHFLVQFRRRVPEAPTLLWIDAVCINQTDVV